ncbi:putative transcription elongation factor [Clavispora lusitaniae]|uniref:Transcription elongation factor n=2 Tax=Clavispora lusitaniae TaxID=36911 RepID=A0ACD0WH93_CLALS|nr:transcription elongation factor spt4 [Clavispora lusitaniae]KAF7583380.1 Transcription elongation factor SPT4 [Clavispora lusitaniae]OVF06252.1 putative transcription elongation factor [Clavispora lusitaniae]QFZ26665.1 putative transcription elongation factor [Clavispora lusitaniae]QFZ32333.1 putative transcription elongation factor [Clavispora lusitaniae]
MSSKTERACMLCGIIQTYRRFLEQGCPNCESVLHYADNEDGQIQDCTSPSFEGLVALGDDNKASWVARWLRIDSFVAGLYAVKVNGKLPAYIISQLEEQNISYRPRDGSAED